MFGWFHCSAVHSLSLSMDMPIWSNLLVPPFVLPQFHHFRHSPYWSPSLSQSLSCLHWRSLHVRRSMTSQVGSWRCDESLTLLQCQRQVGCRTSLWEACACVVPWLWNYVGGLDLNLACTGGQGLGFALMIASSFGATSTGAFRLLCFCGYFSCWYFCCCMGCVIQIDGSTN